MALTLGGVQEFIGAARRTVDLWTASRLVSHLSHTAAQAAGGRLVLPAGGAGSGNAFPNRILVAVPAGSAVVAARAATTAVHEEWRALARAVHGSRADDLAAAPHTVEVRRTLSRVTTTAGPVDEVASDDRTPPRAGCRASVTSPAPISRWSPSGRGSSE